MQLEINNLPLPAFTTDQKGVVTSINPNAVQALRIDMEKIDGLELFDILPNLKMTDISQWLCEKSPVERHWKSLPVAISNEATVLRYDISASHFGGEESKEAGTVFILTETDEASIRAESNRNFKMAVSQSIDGIAIADMSGNIQFVNPAWSAMHGWSEEELIGKNLAIFHNAEQMEKEVKPFNVIVIQEGAHKGMVNHIHKDGSSFLTYMSSSVIHNEQNESIGMIGITRDITELARSRSELEQVRNTLEDRVRERTRELTIANDKLRSEIADRFRVMKALQESLLISSEIINSIPSGLVIFQFVRPDRLILVEGNAVAKKLTGVDFNEIRGQEIRDFWPESKSFGILDFLLDVVETGNPFVSDEMFLDDDRVDGIFDLRAFSMAGNRLGIVFDDVTSRKIFEKALLESEARFRSIFSGVVDAIYLSSTDGIVLDANPAASKMTGYTHEELVGMHAADLVPDETARKLSLLAEKVKEKGSIHTNGFNLTKKGKEFPVEMSFTLVKIEDEDRVVVISRDISKRKNLETAYKQKAEEAELYNDILTHDIGNIGQTNLTYMDLLLSEDYGSINDEQRSFLEACQRQTRRCSVLVDRIRTIKHATTISNNVLIPMDLSELISDTIRAFESTEHDKQFKIDFLTVENATIMADNLVYQLFINLLDNTVKHCQNETVEVAIRVTEKEIKGERFGQIVLEDNGPGIEDDLKQVIFNRFETVGERKGTGIGLAIVKALVKKYNGEILVEDRVPGDFSMGSRFIVLLPIAPN